jgi:hypothetical protein
MVAEGGGWQPERGGSGPSALSWVHVSVPMRRCQTRWSRSRKAVGAWSWFAPDGVQRASRYTLVTPNGATRAATGQHSMDRTPDVSCPNGPGQHAMDGPDDPLKVEVVLGRVVMRRTGSRPPSSEPSRVLVQGNSREIVANVAA